MASVIRSRQIGPRFQTWSAGLFFLASPVLFSMIAHCAEGARVVGERQMRERVKIDKVAPDKKKSKAPKVAKSALGADEDESGEKFDTVIYINDRWRLAWDGIQYHVQSKHTRETGTRAGTSYWRNIAYVCHFGDALLWLARRRIYSVPGTYAGVESLQALNDRLDTIENEIRSTMKEFMRKRFNQKTHELETPT